MADPRISLTDAIRRWLQVDRSKNPKFKERVNYLVKVLSAEKDKDQNPLEKLLDIGWQEASGTGDGRRSQQDLPSDQQTCLRNALSLLGVLGKPAAVAELLRPAKDPHDPSGHRRDKARQLREQLELHGWLDDALDDFLNQLASVDPRHVELPNPFGSRLPQRILSAGSLAEQLAHQPVSSAADRMARHALRNEVELAWKEAQAVDPQHLSPEQERIRQTVIARYQEAVDFDNLLKRWL